MIKLILVLISIIFLILYIIEIRNDKFYTGFSEELPYRQQYYTNTPIKEWAYQMMP